MRKLITIALAGRVYHIEEGGHAALKAWHDAAERRLAGSPERTEVLTDLERALAERFAALPDGGSPYVAEAAIRDALREMGPVEVPAGDAAAGAPGNRASGYESAASHASGGSAASATPPPKRLYRLPAEGMLGGVCAGIAAYFNFDVVWIRLGFVALTLLTGGVWILIWLAALFVTPKAGSAAPLAAVRSAGA